MWGNQSFSGSSPKSRFNSTLPAFVTSPMSTRQRQSDRLKNESMNTSVLSAAGPPLSSPFMPQIKRALGLEPNQRRPYGGVQRRHSFNATGYQSSACLPHVVLNKSHQPPLKERNTSMLKRSSTVKIAPLSHGKIASPSMYQMRNKSVTREDKTTPDTYAVLSALIERRKRPNASHEDSHEVPVQHAKRRRQESQQSNASTSSMPSMPDNLPDLSNTDFSIRIETPDINRPSRPSQEEAHSVWDGNTSISRPRQESRNNPILSSLSSSKRFAQSQRMKRRAENTENETENLIMKSQRKAPPKLSHFNSPLDTSLSVTGNATILNGDTSLPLTNGQSDTVSPSEKSAQNIPQTEKPVDKPATLKQLPSLKKKSSLNSPLSQQSSIRKVQYANVVATLDDYDSDREAENRRVQQMLNDVDKPFSTPKAETPEIKLTNINTTTTVTMSQSVQPSSSVTATSTAPAISSNGSVTSVAVSTDVLVVPRSPIQEVGDSSVPVISTSTSVTKSNKTLSSLLSSESKLTSAITSGDLTSLQASGNNCQTSTTTLNGNFNFGVPHTSALSAPKETLPLSQTSLVLSSASGVPSLSNGSVSTTVISQAGTKDSQVLGGTLTQNKRLEDIMPSRFTFVAPSCNTFTSPTSEVIGFGFSSNSPRTVTQSGATVQSPGQTSLGGFGVASSTITNAVSSGISQAAQAGGFTFGTSTSTSSTSTQPLGISTTSASTAAPGTNATGGFTFGLTSAAPAKTSSGFSFGTSATAASSTAGGFTFGAPTVSTSSAAPVGFTFNPVSTTSGPSSSTVGNNFTSVSSSSGGFSFGTASVSSTSTPSTGGFSFGLKPSSVTTPLSGNPASTAKSEPTTFSGFGQKPLTQASAGGFTFGSTLSNTGSSSGPTFGSSTTNLNPAFAFGGNVATTSVTTSAAPFTFNSGATSTTKSTTPFTFGVVANKTTAATPFTFNAGTASSTLSTTQTTTSANTGFTFGQTSNSSNTFQFGGTNSAKTSGFAFGSANQTSAFGMSTSQAPAFGTSNKPPAFGPAFGSTNQTSVFGSTNQPPTFGTSNQAPGFGSTNQVPAFGSTNQSSVFGNTSSQPSVFGAPTFGAGTTNQLATNSVFGAPANTQQASSSVFGAPATTQQASSSVFGTSANISSQQSVFGNVAGTAPGFGKSHSMPTFGSNNSSNTGTFNFGGQPAPNVNPFGQGQTTPAKQTGSAFGSLNTDSTPQNQTGSVFAFGQSNKDSVKKGFDFSAAAGAGTPSAGGFNFAAAASSTPVFNFGATASTPTAGFGTPTGPPSFSIGTGDAPRPPRPIAKGRRRMPRR